VTPARRPDGAPVRLADLHIGDLLAEGGEGKVYLLPERPHLVFKSYRRPVAPDSVDELIAWPDRSLDGMSRRRVDAAAAWPLAEVLDDSCAVAGLLMPRAPKRFSVRHRDGATRLASLSYLTTDPTYRAAAYGLQLPAPAAIERFGLIYALARLLQAFEAGEPRIGHGDLSTKNVLWSLQRGPEVFVIDCDNADRFDPTGAPLGDPGRRRAMTPNWDDPAVNRGDNPTIASDRYSLALIFLRIVGAANYPIQARQRSGEQVTVDFPLPPWLQSGTLLRAEGPLWQLCGRGLSLTSPDGRPPPSAWVGALEAVLDSIGGVDTMRAVWASQGGGQPSPLVSLPAPGATDVQIRPVAAPRGRGRQSSAYAAMARERRYDAARRPLTARSSGVVVLPSRVSGAASPTPPSDAVTWIPDLTDTLRKVGRWWLDAHRKAMRAVRARGGPRGRTRIVAFCAAIDMAVAVVVVFIAAMLVSPFLGI
jgi:hypothetical protein